MLKLSNKMTSFVVDYLHLYFSSLVPRVKSTNPQTRSLKIMPFKLPPQAKYMYCKILIKIIYWFIEYQNIDEVKF